MEAILAALALKLATPENLDLLIDLVDSVVTELVRKGELTVEQANERRLVMLSRMQQSHWQHKPATAGGSQDYYGQAPWLS